MFPRARQSSSFVRTAYDENRCLPSVLDDFDILPLESLLGKLRNLFRVSVQDVISALDDLDAHFIPQQPGELGWAEKSQQIKRHHLRKIRAA
jgi:hypothetical protein